MITIGGMIGVGKSTAAKEISKHLNSPLLVEHVEGNTLLEKFYTATPEEKEKYRWPFKLQIHFLTSRYAQIRQAFQDQNSVLDRSIYEDWYFAKVNTDIGDISDDEFEIYENLLHVMMEDLQDMPKKSPDLFVYLRADFDTILRRIGARDRSFETDPALIEYYRLLWEGYDDWALNKYNSSDILIFDTQKYDLSHPENVQLLLDQVDQKLKQVRN